MWRSCVPHFPGYGLSNIREILLSGTSCWILSFSLSDSYAQGIIRIHLLAARGLGSKDKYVKGLIEGKSDPYALVRVGTQTFCSRVINEDLNPQWRETYEVGQLRSRNCVKWGGPGRL